MVGNRAFIVWLLLAELADENFQDEQDDDDGDPVVPEQDTEDEHFEVVLDVDKVFALQCAQCDGNDECDDGEKQVVVPSAENEREPTSESENDDCDTDFCFGDVRCGGVHRIVLPSLGRFPLMFLFYAR